VAAVVTTRDEYERFLVRRHAPAHGGRTADQWAAFLLPHLRDEMRVLDIGCGPGSITLGLTGRSIGVDRRPLVVEGLTVVGADGAALPFPDAVFDAIYMNAVLQQVADALAVLREARRVARPGAVIGVADADWGSQVMHPADLLIERGYRIREVVRDGCNVRVGRELRGLLTGAGFERVEVTVTGRAVGGAQAVAAWAAFESAWFEAPEVIVHVSELDLSDESEMAAIAMAWRRWAADPAACSATLWFSALGWSP
jgi:SAM-dependent methyltransferase